MADFVLDRGFMQKRTLIVRKAQIGLLVLCVVAISALSVRPAEARRRGYARGSVVFVGGYFYDPFFGPYPWWSPAAYPYPYYPVFDNRAELRVLAEPRDAAVYVDGYYAGIVDDFDGFFQRLPLPPGEHEIVLYREGYRTAHQKLYLSPDSTYKLHYTMEKLPAGETSEPPPSPPPVPAPPAGSYMPPRTPRGAPLPGAPPPPEAAPRSSDTGALAIRVQPGDAEVTIDAERWAGSENERLVVQLSAGRHRVEVFKSGYRRFITEIDVRGGQTTPLNVSLSRE